MTFNFSVAPHRYAATVSRFADGRLAEVLLNGRPCVFRQFPDTDFGNSRTVISVIPGQGFR
jgi:hypothetical protein